jgi:hypothetical protein
MSKKAESAVLLMAAILLLGTQISQAGSATWNATPGSGDWNTTTNWTPANVPNAATDTATFALSNTTGVSLSADTEVDGIVFEAGAIPFTITASPSFVLILSGTGITNNSGTMQDFVAAVAGANGGAILFTDNATAGSLTAFTNNGGTVSGGGGSTTEFLNTSTAGNGTFINNGGTVSGANAAATFFSATSTAGNGTFINNGGVVGAATGFTFLADSSTAGNGAFTNNGGTISGANGGSTNFAATSSAGNASFTNNGGTVSGAGGGETFFFDSSTAGNGTLTANAGAGGGGGIFFFDDSTGGTARAQIFGNGNLDISAHNAPGVTIGSIEGSGAVLLGANNLTVGTNTLNTTFSGVIQDGGAHGIFSKVGNGVLTFQGGTSNDHIGDMITLSITSGSTINLNFSGTPDTIGGLIVDGVAQPAGLYGSAASGAPNQLSVFAGTGQVQVVVPPVIALHHYAFNGLGVVDSLGTADGTLFNGASVMSGRLNLDGIDDYVEFSQKIVPTAGDFSIAFFAQELSPQPTFTEIISQGFSGGPGFYVGYNPSHEFRIGDDLINTLVPFPSDALTHHYAVTVGSDTRLYIDGSLVATFGRISVTSGGDNTRLGRQFDPFTEFFHGNLDELWVFSGTLSSGEVASLARPVITSPATAAATQGQLFVYQVTATGAPDSYSATPLPAGLRFDSQRGIIGGTPTSPGTTPVQLSASNSIDTGIATLTLTVQPTPSFGPVIASSASITARTGVPFAYEVFTTGGSSTARLSVNGLPPGLSADPETGRISGTPASDGSFGLTLTVTDGPNVTTSTLQLTFISDLTVPVITSSRETSLPTGHFFTYTIVAPGSDPSDSTTYSFIGVLPNGLSFDAATGTISGTYNVHAQNGGALLGNVQLVSSNSSGTATSPLSFFQTVPATAVNISTRLAVGTSDNVLIGGFIVTGNAPKKIIVRAVGPELSDLGVPGALQDTTLELHDGTGALLGTNDDWQTTQTVGAITADQSADIQASGVAPTDARESAIIATLAPYDPNVGGPVGLYTAIVRGKDGTTGVASVELYDLGTASLDVSSKAQLANISTRGVVQTGDNVMIGGFIVRGDFPATVVVRAIGPSLTAKGVSGALQDTTLELHDGTGALIGSNDNWQDDPGAAQIQANGVAPSDPHESATIVTLEPGNYTAIVRGVNDTTGVALVEAYVLQ